MAVPLRRHWNVSGDEPLAVTRKVAGCPATTDTLVGTLFAMLGGTALTVSVAAALVTLPAAFETTTAKTAPLSLGCAAASA